MKFINFIICSVVLLVSFNEECAAVAYPKTETLSRSVLVYDVNSELIIYHKNIHAVYPIASLTKLMTAIVSLDGRFPTKEKILVTSADRDYIKHTRSRLTVGSSLNRSDMLRIALMSSENRAAAALSRHYPSGRKGFIRKMNLKARQYGMLHTHYDDPTGLSTRSVSTAHDLLLLVKHASQYPVIRRFSTGKRYVVNTGKGTLTYRTSNGLINNKKWKIKLQKTGFTNEAGHCMAINTTIRNKDYIIIILGSPSRYGHYSDAIRLKKWILKSIN